jgi:CheY-like chemotaxis protein
MPTTTRCAEATVSYFTFLPTLMEEQALPDPRVLDDPQGGHLTPGAPRRVLVIDDSLLMRSAAALGLGRVAGWHVATAASGREGVELAVSYRPDAILLDVVMPELDGPATLRALREQATTRDMPVVFLTADAGEPGDLLALGAAGVIAKPFKPEELAEQLGEVLGWDMTDGSWT